MAPLPVVKIVILLLRQISKPCGNYFKKKVKTSPFLRKCVMPLGHWSYWAEIRIKMHVLNLGKPSEIQVNENVKTERGSEILGSLITYAFPTILAILGYMHNSANTRDKEIAKDQRFKELEDLVIELKHQLIEQESRIEMCEQNASYSMAILQDFRTKQQPSSYAANFIEKALMMQGSV